MSAVGNLLRKTRNIRIELLSALSAFQPNSITYKLTSRERGFGHAASAVRNSLLTGGMYLKTSH